MIIIGPIISILKFVMWFLKHFIKILEISFILADSETPPTAEKSEFNRLQNQVQNYFDNEQLFKLYSTDRHLNEFKNQMYTIIK